MRSRAEADLATLHNDVKKLSSLASVWGAARVAQVAHLPCNVGSELVFSNVSFGRGQSQATLHNLTLYKGSTVAITGPNGCGKSTLFALLSSGQCSLAPVALSGSIRVRPGSVITIPGPRVEQMTQKSYFPLFTRPVEWFMQKQALASFNQNLGGVAANTTLLEGREMIQVAEHVAVLANQLHFYESGEVTSDDLMQPKEDWYSTLSGGQRSKAEFIRTVFLEPTCPDLLLIDEGFAALDPHSKAVVQRKLKQFCRASLVLVIYHTDHKSSMGDSKSCVPAAYFDEALHFDNETATITEVC